MNLSTRFPIDKLFVFSAVLTLFAVAARADTPPQETRYLLVQPVLTRNDASEAPAALREHREALAGVYRQAGVELVWLPQVTLDSTATRDGTIGPDAIVSLGKKRGLWGKGVPRINLIFVDAINGKKGPRGLGMTPGPICFAALPEKSTNPAMEAFCIAHEMGHCLGLIHAVDDPRVDDNAVSIMGDGPFAERIGSAALHPPHVETIRNSTLLLRSAKPRN